MNYMNLRLCLPLFGGCVLWGAPLLGQGSFEGAVTYQLTDTAGKTITMLYQAKGSRIRMDMSGGEGVDAASPALSYDEASRQVTAMIVQARVYVATSMDSLAKPEGGKPVMKATGS